MKKRLTKIAQVTVAMLRENRGLIACLIGEIRSGLSGECSDLRGDCSGLRGDCSGLRGDCSDLRGECSDLRGDCSGLWGDCSGLSGDCSGLWGNLDACEITDDERKTGVKIKDLIEE